MQPLKGETKWRATLAASYDSSHSTGRNGATQTEIFALLQTTRIRRRRNAEGSFGRQMRLDVHFLLLIFSILGTSVAAAKSLKEAFDGEVIEVDSENIGGVP